MAESSDGNGWVALVQGGLPRIIAGPAGHAISRLIGSVVNIPVAMLDGVTQGIKDNTEARSAMTQVLADAAARYAASDPTVVYRAMDTMLSRQIRAQQCKDAIAQSAVENLMLDPPPQSSAGPSDDWLNVFERLAEEASSATLQDLFARILAGEIRKPGSISQMTLQLASCLDVGLARQIELAASHALPSGWVIADENWDTQAHPDYQGLAEIGFITAPTLLMSSGDETDDSGQLVVQFVSGDRLVAKYPGRRVASFVGRPLTRAGKEIVACLKLGPDLEFLSRKFEHDGALVKIE